MEIKDVRFSAEWVVSSKVVKPIDLVLDVLEEKPKKTTLLKYQGLTALYVISKNFS